MFPQSWSVCRYDARFKFSSSLTWIGFSSCQNLTETRLLEEMTNLSVCFWHCCVSYTKKYLFCQFQLQQKTKTKTKTTKQQQQQQQNQKKNKTKTKQNKTKPKKKNKQKTTVTLCSKMSGAIRSLSGVSSRLMAARIISWCRSSFLEPFPVKFWASSSHDCGPFPVKSEVSASHD